MNLKNYTHKVTFFLLTCLFETYKKVSVNEFEVNSLYCGSLLGFTWFSRVKYTG